MEYYSLLLLPPLLPLHDFETFQPKGAMPCRLTPEADTRHNSVYAVYGNLLEKPGYTEYRSNSKGFSYPRFWSGTRQGFPRISWFGKLRAPVASRQNVGLGWFFFFFFLAYGSPFGILLAIYRTPDMTRQLPLVRYSIVWNQ